MPVILWFVLLWVRRTFFLGGGLTTSLGPHFPAQDSCEYVKCLHIFILLICFMLLSFLRESENLREQKGNFLPHISLSAAVIFGYKSPGLNQHECIPVQFCRLEIWRAFHWVNGNLLGSLCSFSSELGECYARNTSSPPKVNKETESCM